MFGLVRGLTTNKRTDTDKRNLVLVLNMHETFRMGPVLMERKKGNKENNNLGLILLQRVPNAIVLALAFLVGQLEELLELSAGHAVDVLELPDPGRSATLLREHEEIVHAEAGKL